MKLLKTLMVLLLAAALLSSFALAGTTTEITDNNAFYTANKNNCIDHSYTYFMNGTAGYVTVMSQPDGGKLLHDIPNGISLRVHKTYEQDGEDWGLVEFVYKTDGTYIDHSGPTSISGWVDMRELALNYDKAAFADEFAGAIYSFSGDFTLLNNANPVVFYEFPGSSSYTVYTASIDSGDMLQFYNSYEDESGNRWAQFSSPSIYIYEDMWICLTDPASTAFAGELDRSVELIPASIEAASTNMTIVWIIAALVAVIIISVAICVHTIWKRRNPYKKP